MRLGVFILVVLLGRLAVAPAAIPAGGAAGDAAPGGVDWTRFHEADPSPDDRPPVALTWHTRFEEARLEAVAGYKAILLFATMPSCGYCRVMKERVLSRSEVQDRLQRFSLLELNTRDHPRLARRLGIRGVPVTLILSADGRVRGRQAGYMDREQMLAFLGRALNEALAGDVAEERLADLERLEEGTLPAEGWARLLGAMDQETLRRDVRERVRARSAFPAEELIRALSHDRLAVRLGALELLEEAAGDDFDFDPWRAPDADGTRASLAAWRRWASSGAGDGEETYSSLTVDQVRGYLRDLVSDDRTRNARALRMLEYGDAGAARVVRTFLDESPDLSAGVRRRVREALYTMILPGGTGHSEADLAHRLVFGTLDMRMRAIRTVGESGRRAFPVLADFLRDPAPLIRETAADALAASGDLAVVPVFADHLEREDDIDVLISMIKGLGEIRSKRGLEMLGELSRHDNEDVVIAALNSMARLGSRRAEEDVREALTDSRWRVRVAALEAAGELEIRDARDTVERLLEDPDPFVRFKAVMTYARVAGEEGREVLGDLFVEDDAIKAPVLSAWCSLDLDIPERFQDALAASPPAVVLDVIHALEKCGREGLSLAVPLASSETLDVACAALRFIAGIENRTHAADRRLLAALDSRVPEKAHAVLMNLQNEVEEGPAGGFSGFGAFFDEAALTGRGRGGPEGEATVGRGEDRMALDDLFSAFEDGEGETAAAAAPTNPPPSGESAQEGEAPAVELGSLFDAFDPEEPADNPSASAPDGAATLPEAIRRYLEPAWDYDLRLAAALALLDYRSLDGLDLLRGGLDRLSREQRAGMAERLGLIGTPEALSLAEPLLRDRSEDVRKAMALAMRKQLTREDWADALFGELVAPQARLRPAELYGYHFQVERRVQLAVRPWVERYLESGRPDLISLGLALLESSWRRNDEERVRPFTEHESPLVRRAAWHLLAVRDPASFTRDLEAVAGDPSERVREVVPAVYGGDSSRWTHRFSEDQTSAQRHFYFGGSRRRAPRFDEEAERWLRVLAEDPSPLVRTDAMLTLWERGEEIEVSRLAETLEEFSDPAIPGRRVGALVKERYRRLDADYRVLLPYLEYTWVSDEDGERIREHFREESRPLSADSQTVVLRNGDRAPGLAPVEEGGGTASVDRISLVYFSEPGCGDCRRVSEWLEMLGETFPELDVREYRMSRIKARKLNDVLLERFDAAPEDQRVTPAVFAGGGYLTGEAIDFARLGDLVARSFGTGFEQWLAQKTEEDPAVGEEGGGARRDERSRSPPGDAEEERDGESAWPGWALLGVVVVGAGIWLKRAGIHRTKPSNRGT